MVLAGLVLALPAGSHAALTISSCRSDSLTVMGKVKLSASAARKVRGATAELRFQALPLFGLPRTAASRRGAAGQQTFSALESGNWVGVMSWRFKKRGRTVLSGSERSQPVRVGRTKGRASCTLAEGVKPVDKTPPALFINPDDAAWHRGQVQLSARDDFSGVKSMSYSLDGGPKTATVNGSLITVAAQGAHTIAWEATDVAGNTGTRSAVVNVDTGAPTKPALSRPNTVTASTKPAFQWSASTDSGSGMRSYVLTIQKSDGTVVAFQTVDANTTSVQSAATLTEGETYKAVVTAVDNTAEPWTTASDPLTFRVDSSPDATSYSPPSGTILSGSAKATNFTIALDRPANPSTVSGGVSMTRGDGTAIAGAISCNSPCTTITFDPNSNLTEGHYSLSFSGLKSAEDGAAFAGSADYAVPYTESGSIGPANTSSLLCSTTPTGSSTSAPPFPVTAAAPGQTAFLDFDLSYSGPGGWTMQAMNGTAPIGDPLYGSAGGHYRLNFPSSSSGNLAFKLTVACGASADTSASASNLFGSRYP